MAEVGRPHWPSLPEVNEALLKYHRSYGVFPKENLGKVQSFLQPFLNKVQSGLSGAGLQGAWETVGSVSEGVHEIHPDGSYELDMKYTVTVDDSFVSIKPIGPGWATLEKSYWSFFGLRALFCLASTDHLPPIFNDVDQVSKASVLDVFESVCKLYAEQLGVPSARFSRQGPAITMKGKTPAGLKFSVDLVPAISIPNRSVFVAKPGPRTNQTDEAWNKSFSLEERHEYPQNSDWEKACLRILKAIRDRCTELSQLQSYVLKNILFLQLADEDRHDPWTERSVSQKVWELLRDLEEGLSEGFIPQYFDRSGTVNLIRKLSEAERFKMHSFVHNLCTHKSAFLKAFKVKVEVSQGLVVPRTNNEAWRYYVIESRGCRYCGEPGHVTDECRHGYRLHCWGCGKSGHKRSRCRSSV